MFRFPVDKNECSETSPCDSKAECTNTPGSYTCQCNPGFAGDGTKESCKGKTMLVTIIYLMGMG